MCPVAGPCGDAGEPPCNHTICNSDLPGGNKVSYTCSGACNGQGATCCKDYSVDPTGGASSILAVGCCPEGSSCCAQPIGDSGRDTNTGCCEKHLECCDGLGCARNATVQCCPALPLALSSRRDARPKFSQYAKFCAEGTECCGAGSEAGCCSADEQCCVSSDGVSAGACCGKDELCLEGLCCAPDTPPCGLTNPTCCTNGTSCCGTACCGATQLCMAGGHPIIEAVCVPSNCTLAGVDLWPISSQVLGNDTVLVNSKRNESYSFNPCGPLISETGTGSYPENLCPRGSTSVCVFPDAVALSFWPPEWSGRTAQGDLRQYFVGYDSGGYPAHVNLTYRCGTELARAEYIDSFELSSGGYIYLFDFHTNLVCQPSWFSKNKVAVIAASSAVGALSILALVFVMCRRRVAAPAGSGEQGPDLRETSPLVQSDN